MVHTRCGQLLAPALALILIGSTQPGEVRFVDDDAPLGGDGLSWDTAYRFLQDALFEAAQGPSVNEIRVGQGTYKPDQDESLKVTPGDREETFWLIDVLALRGGFAGIGANDPDERDITAFETILSGDLLENDDPGDFPFGSSYVDNCFHVVTAQRVGRTASLDGVVVASGSAVFPEDAGGGVDIFSASPTFLDCTIAGNAALRFGGGVSVLVGDPVFERCTLTGNRAGSDDPADGGGMTIDVSSSTTLIDCRFASNVATNVGGGVRLLGGEGIQFVRCTFAQNAVIGPAAGVAGGAGVAAFAAEGSFVDCVFRDNTAFSDSGGFGAALGSGSLHLALLNCLFVGNHAQSRGGAIYGEAQLTNCTLTDNTAAEGGGTNQVRILTNCIVWSNTDDTGMGESAQIAIPGMSPQIDHCCIQGLTGNLGGQGNIDADPLFVDPDNGDHRLSSGSPCIDAGHNWAIAGVADTDLDGNPRFVAVRAEPRGCGEPAVVDVGAYEHQEGKAAEIRFGDIDGSGVVDGTDLMAVFDAWGPCDLGCCLPDLDMDEMVGITDLLILLARWG